MNQHSETNKAPIKPPSHHIQEYNRQKHNRYDDNADYPYYVYVLDGDPANSIGEYHILNMGAKIYPIFPQATLSRIATKKFSITFLSAAEANSFVETDAKKIDPRWLAYIPDTSISRPGLIHDVLPSWPVQDIINNINIPEQAELSRLERVYKTINTNNGESLIASDMIKLFFKGSLPSGIFICGIYFKVYPFVPPAVRCRNCQRFGHGSNICTFKTACEICGENHQNQIMDPCQATPKCSNCKLAHPASDSSCVYFKFFRKVQAFKALLNISKPEAITMVRREYRIRIQADPNFQYCEGLFIDRNPFLERENIVTPLTSNDQTNQIRDSYQVQPSTLNVSTLSAIPVSNTSNLPQGHTSPEHDLRPISPSISPITNAVNRTASLTNLFYPGFNPPATNIDHFTINSPHEQQKRKRNRSSDSDNLNNTYSLTNFSLETPPSNSLVSTSANNYATMAEIHQVRESIPSLDRDSDKENEGDQSLHEEPTSQSKQYDDIINHSDHQKASCSSPNNSISYDSWSNFEKKVNMTYIDNHYSSEEEDIFHPLVTPHQARQPLQQTSLSCTSSLNNIVLQNNSSRFGKSSPDPTSPTLLDKESMDTIPKTKPGEKTLSKTYLEWKIGARSGEDEIKTQDKKDTTNKPNNKNKKTHTKRLSKVEKKNAKRLRRLEKAGIVPDDRPKFT